MESSQARIEILEQSILNLRQELESQAQLADKELSDVDQTLRKIMDEHQQLEALLRTMERQLAEATQESERQKQELRDRDYELAQLKSSIMDRDREIESLGRKLKSTAVQVAPVQIPQDPSPHQSSSVQEISLSISQMLLAGLVILLGGVVISMLAFRQSGPPLANPNAIESPRN